MATTTTRCEIFWCVCAPLPGKTICAVHAKHPTLRPQELEPDEELCDGTVEKCSECDGTGKCHCCDGSGEVEYRCTSCSDTHYADCHSCDGEGDCPDCDGVKVEDGVRKKTEATT